MDELEAVLGIRSCAMNWPLGNGPEFRGIYDRGENKVHLFERVVGGMYRAPVNVTGLDDPLVREKLDPDTYASVREQIEMVELAGSPFDHAQVLHGKLTPVFFGSGVNNFGVQLLLDRFLEFSAPPRGRSVSPV